MRMVNTGEATVRVEALGVEVEPGKTCEVQDGYAKPRRASNGGRIPAVIENLAPQLRPDDASELEEWLKAPPEAPPPAPSLETRIATGMAPGIAEILQNAAADDPQTAFDAPAETAPKRKGKRL